MKFLRVILPAALLFAAVFAALRRNADPEAKPLATPEECLEAYREACVHGETDVYFRCLAEPLRTDVRNRSADNRRLAEQLRSGMKDLKGWSVTMQPRTDERDAVAIVHEIRAIGNRRIRYRLVQEAGNWSIVSIDPPEEEATPIPFGTPVGEEPAPKN